MYVYVRAFVYLHGSLVIIKALKLISMSAGKIKSVKLTPNGPKEGRHDRFVFAVRKIRNAQYGNCTQQIYSCRLIHEQGH